MNAGRVADEVVPWGASSTPGGASGRDSNARNQITHERRPAAGTERDGATDKGCRWPMSCSAVELPRPQPRAGFEPATSPSNAVSHPRRPVAGRREPGPEHPEITPL